MAREIFIISIVSELIKATLEYYYELMCSFRSCARVIENGRFYFLYWRITKSIYNNNIFYLITVLYIQLVWTINEIMFEIPILILISIITNFCHTVCDEWHIQHIPYITYITVVALVVIWTRENYNFIVKLVEIETRT